MDSTIMDPTPDYPMQGAGVDTTMMDDLAPSNSNGDSNVNSHSASTNSLQNGFTGLHPLKEPVDLAPPFSTSEEDSEMQTSSIVSTQGPPPRKAAILPTGCCYDPRMKLHANADWSGNPHHPEDPRRIEAIMEAFRQAGLVYQGRQEDLEKELKESPGRWMMRIAARLATEAEICTAHTASHYQWAYELSKKSAEELRGMTLSYDTGRKSLYVGSLTYHAALISAGGAIETCKNVVAGNVKNAIAVIRPPGHHAEHNEAMGFCVFNNVPIAVKVCQADYPEICRKVLILDWDVHHGNGIQNIFYEDPNVLYISLHVYEGGTFYPGQPDQPGIPDGGPEHIGAGAGVGRNVNIGWSSQGMGDGEYLAAFQNIVMPIAQEFDPDFVVISAGFDAAAGDELGGCFVTPQCFSHMTHMLMSLAGGKVAVCLEGGYNLSAISRSALAVAKTLMGEPPERMPIPPINREAALVLQQVKQYQSHYWQCMRTGGPQTYTVRDSEGVRLHDAIRAYQRRHLTNDHTMVPLKILRTRISESFEDQVLVTPDISRANKIMIFIHDPPEFLATPDPTDNTVHAHNAWLNDSVRPYIKWARNDGFAVIDINIPFHISDSSNTGSFHAPLPQSSATDPDSIESQCKELLCYLWDNYISLYHSNCIVLVGVGNAYIGVKQLLTSRDARSRVAGVLSFVTGTLRPVKSETDPHLSSWYKQHSNIWVAPDHACWTDPESMKKVRKGRFGATRISEVTGLSNMMKFYQPVARDWVSKIVREHFEELGLDENGEGGGDDDETQSEE